ncbi:MAG TPA: hypothetical protein VNN77_10305 [candidate division Zixibacteria bacterium]|nr:hypothetical protein [candidate division Zixibacteria bacterium]
MNGLNCLNGYRRRDHPAAKLHHLALLTHQPEPLTDFSKRVSDMEETSRTGNGSIHADMSGKDPDGNLFDLSTIGWGKKKRT